MKIKPIILSGGSGTRLWPLSRESKPKQFFDIFNEKTNLFEETINRINNPNFTKPIIISNKNRSCQLDLFFTREQVNFNLPLNF